MSEQSKKPIVFCRYKTLKERDGTFSVIDQKDHVSVMKGLDREDANSECIELNRKEAASRPNEILISSSAAWILSNIASEMDQAAIKHTLDSRDDYIALMDAIIQEATSRKNNAMENV